MVAIKQGNIAAARHHASRRGRFTRLLGPFFLLGCLALLLWPMLSLASWYRLPQSSREEFALRMIAEEKTKAMTKTVESLRTRISELESAQRNRVQQPTDCGNHKAEANNAKGDDLPAAGGGGPFPLFRDFDIGHMIEGDESWLDLLEYRRILRRPRLSFYVDKIAVRRWLPTQTFDNIPNNGRIDIPRPILLRYKSELRTDLPRSGIPIDSRVIQSMMPEQPDSFDYAAKPSHASSGYGVRVASHGVAPVDYGWGFATKIGRGGGGLVDISELEEPFPEEDDEDVTEVIAARLFEYLSFVPSSLNSWALRHVREPGVVVEERLALWDDDDLPPMEFKVLTIWGRVHVAEWWRGNDHLGRVYRNRTVVLTEDEEGDDEGKGDEDEDEEKKTNKKKLDYSKTVLPILFKWRSVVEIAERLGANKDMFRTDVFVGVSAELAHTLTKATKEEKRAALRVVVSELELHPSLTEVTHLPTYEEAARLWMGGYKSKSFHTVPNTEVPSVYLSTGVLPPLPESKLWIRTRFTYSDYVVAGVNLAEYRMPAGGGTGNDARPGNEKTKDGQEPYELYEEFNIAGNITGNEGWWDLIALRIGLENLSCFYNDKIAVKRYLPTIGLPIPKPLALKYKSELSRHGELEDETEAIVSILPKKKSYVTKPSHSCLGQGVWRVSYKAKSDENDGEGHVIVTKKNKVFDFPEAEYDPRPMAEKLAGFLHLEPGYYGSYMYDHIKPGIVIEERLTAWDDEEVPATEFKVFCIWGRVYVAKWRIGLEHNGLVYRNGTIVNTSTDEVGAKAKLIPEDAQWPRVVEIAERMAANKDMFRTDIFVGVPAGAPSHRRGAKTKEKRAAIKVVVNEFEMQPGMSHMFNGVFEEAARLWIAGYKMLNLRLVPNTEVPEAFRETGSLPEKKKPS